MFLSEKPFFPGLETNWFHNSCHRKWRLTGGLSLSVIWWHWLIKIDRRPNFFVPKMRDFFVGSYVLGHKVFLKQNSIERIVIDMLVLCHRFCWVYLQVLVKLVKKLFSEKKWRNKNETFQKLRFVFVLKTNLIFRRTKNSKPVRRCQVIVVGYRFE